MEGQPGVDIIVTSSLPPSSICKSNGKVGVCTVKIETIFMEHVESECYIGAEKVPYPQAVIGSLVQGRAASCGLMLTDDDTGVDMAIPVKAKMDLVSEVATSETRILAIFERHYVADEITYESKIKDVTVNIEDASYGSKTCISRNDPHMESFDGM